MPSKELTALLEAQIGHELSAHNHYLGIAAYFAFAGRSLDGWGAFFFHQAEEEREHALKVLRFLLDAGVTPRIPEAREGRSSFADPKAAVKSALEAEEGVTRQFEAMIEVALKNKDFRALPLIQWFLDEQVEEEATMKKLLDLLSTKTAPILLEPYLPTHED